MEVENMTHYAICSDDKCYSEVYTKEEIDDMFTTQMYRHVASDLQFDNKDNFYYFSGSYDQPIETYNDTFIPIGVVSNSITIENSLHQKAPIVSLISELKYSSNGWYVRLNYSALAPFPMNYTDLDITIYVLFRKKVS